MTEHLDEWDEPSAEEVAAARPEPTGVARVDAVLDTVAALDRQPLEEHVTAFESAHDELRRTLDDDPSRPARQPGAPSTPGPR